MLLHLPTAYPLMDAAAADSNSVNGCSCIFRQHILKLMLLHQPTASTTMDAAALAEGMSVNEFINK